MSPDLRRVLLAAFQDPKGNDALRELIAKGLVMFILTADSVEFRVTPKGKLQFFTADAFEPEHAS